MLKKIKNDKALTQAFIYFILLAVFLLINNHVAGKYVMYSRFDDLIPFVPAFVIAYYTWYAFFFLTALFLFLRSREDFIRTILSINLSMAITLAIYVLFPNYQDLRPTVYAADFFSQWVRSLQEFDSASSVCPSLHVSVTLTLFLGIINSLYYKDRRSLKLAALIITIMICASTVFIKQHSIVDVAAGMLLSFLIYLFVYKFRPVFLSSGNDSGQEKPMRHLIK